MTLVRCVSEMSAISILLFCKVASSSFLRLIRSLEFQVRIRRELDVKLLVCIFCVYVIYEDCEDLGEEG